MPPAFLHHAEPGSEKLSSSTHEQNGEVWSRTRGRTSNTFGLPQRLPRCGRAPSYVALPQSALPHAAASRFCALWHGSWTRGGGPDDFRFPTGQPLNAYCKFTKLLQVVTANGENSLSISISRITRMDKTQELPNFCACRWQESLAWAAWARRDLSEPDLD